MVHAIRCIRDSQLGQAKTSTAKTLTSIVATGIQRRQSRRRLIP